MPRFTPNSPRRFTNRLGSWAGDASTPIDLTLIEAAAFRDDFVTPTAGITETTSPDGVSGGTLLQAATSLTATTSLVSGGLA